MYLGRLWGNREIVNAKHTTWGSLQYQRGPDLDRVKSSRWKRNDFLLLYIFQLRPSSSMNGPVRLSVRPSVCLSHLFHYVPVIVSS